MRTRTVTKAARRVELPPVSRERAIQIAVAHNCVSLAIAQKYTDSELREVLHHLKLKANF
jgi:hypothetical protein